MTQRDTRLQELIDSHPEIAALHRESQLEKISQTMRMAEVRCLPFEELLVRIEHLWDDDAASEIVYRVCEESFSDNQAQALAVSISRLAAAADQLPSAAKSAVLRSVGRILARLPSRFAAPIAEPWLGHKHKFRRQIAYRVFQRTGVPAESAPQLLVAFQQTGDQECLQLLARNPSAIAAVDSAAVAELMDDEYWRMRVIQSLLVVDKPRGISLSTLYPIEFIRAVGREKDASLLSDVQILFDKNFEDLEFVSIYAWALGQLGAQEELSRVRALIYGATGM